MSALELPCSVSETDRLFARDCPTGDGTIWIDSEGEDPGYDGHVNTSINLSLADAHKLREWLNRNLKDLEA